MAIATGELYQVTIVCQQNGQTVENVLMFRERDGLSTDAQIAQSVKDFWDIYRTVIVIPTTLIELRAKRMTPIQLDTLIFHANGTNNSGAHGGPNTNSMLAAVTTLRTGTAGKRHRGRVYTFGIPQDSLTDNENKLNSAYLNELQSMWDDVLAAYGDADGTDTHLALGIYSRLIGGTKPYTVAGWQAVTQCVPHSILGTQRRRREGVGV